MCTNETSRTFEPWLCLLREHERRSRRRFKPSPSPPIPLLLLSYMAATIVIDGERAPDYIVLRTGVRSASSLEILPDSAALAARPETAQADGRTRRREEHHGQMKGGELSATEEEGAAANAIEWVGGQKKEEQRIYR